MHFPRIRIFLMFPGLKPGSRWRYVCLITGTPAPWKSHRLKPARIDYGKKRRRRRAKTARDNGWQLGPGVLQTSSAFNWSGLNVSNQELEFELCHSIGVCARRPLWAANEMCSSALSALSCSASAVSGRWETASLACARPRRTPRPMRNAECGVRNEQPRTTVSIPHSAVRTPRTAFRWFACRNSWRRQASPRGAPASR